MQLKKTKNISKALAMAACGLLSAQSTITYAADTQVSNQVNDQEWQFDAALMYYGETGRVTALEGIVNAEKKFGDTSTLETKLVWDSLTGSSASGAVAQNELQTFTRPSGNGEYTIAPGDTPLDDTFQDTRVQLSANWTEVLSPIWTVNGGVYGSKEYDYFSIGLNGGVQRSFNQDNTTLFLGSSYSLDQISPVGDKPIPFAEMVLRKDYISEDTFKQAFNATRGKDTDDKYTADLLLGLTQIINKNWLVQANYGFSSVDGYLTDPYKILSEVDASGTTQGYRYEKRPDSRQKHSAYLATKGAIGNDILDASYRFTTDDWGIDSHTLETHYRHYFSKGFYGQIHLRYYMQSAADFYQPFLVLGATPPKFASADYRIGELNDYTIGIKFGHNLSNGHKISYRLEYLEQTPKNNGVASFGQLSQFDLYPKVKAIIAQVSYSF